MALTLSAQDQPQVTVARWPGDRQVAISLTFDDAMKTHLEVVGPILKKHRLVGTFFVATGRDVWGKRLDDWRSLAAEGHEIASHTVSHPCLLERIRPHAQDYTPEMMEAELRDSARQIRSVIPTRRGLTFAYPCGNISFGPVVEQARNAALYLRYVADNYFAARGYGAGGAAQEPDALSVLTVTDLGITEGRGFSELLAMAQPALQRRAWGIYTFHGVGGEWLSISADTLDELSGYLAHHSEIWTATFGDVIRYIQESKALRLQLLRSDAQSVELALDWPLDPQVFDLALTLKTLLPGGWTDVKVEADGKELPSRVAGAALLVDVYPKIGRVLISKK